MIEQKIKTQLGEYVFAIMVLQNQLEELQAEIKDLKKQDENQSKRPKSN